MKWHGRGHNEMVTVLKQPLRAGGGHGRVQIKVGGKGG